MAVEISRMMWEKKSFSTPAFRRKTRVASQKCEEAPERPVPWKPALRAALRSPVTATRSVVNSLFENLFDFFGVDGSAGVQPINGICYFGLPEKRCCLGPPLWSLASESL